MADNLDFEWDEGKAAANLQKHGLRFIDVVELFDGRPSVTKPSDKNGEMRYVTITMLENRLIAVIWTVRQEKRRVISMRRARSNEERAYSDLHG
ncbi:MAG: BrnT family toxin [Beijerinckiaceae bacterium]